MIEINHFYMLFRTTIAALLLVPAMIFAQTGEEFIPPAFTGGGVPQPEGTVSCFDYYRFGSVQVDVVGSVAQTVSGVPLTFSGMVKNQNDYPIVDGRVYVKIFRMSDRGDMTQANGYDLVDEFVAQDNIALPAQGEKPLTFEWKVPAYAPSGEYRLAAFFISGEAYNLLGLSFTDDVTGNTSDFFVTGEVPTGVAFNKDTVTVAGEQYRFASFPPRAPKDAPVEIAADLVNTTNASQTIPVTYTIYAWDAQREENVITTKEETVTLPSGATTPVRVTISDTAHPVYLVTLEAAHQDTRSLLNVRFVREGVDRARLNFPALTTFPLTEGEEATLFSCLHSMGTADILEDGKLTLTLKDKNGKVFHTYEYQGGVTGAMMAVKDAFVPKKTYDTFTLSAELSIAGQVMDTAEMHYNCADIDPTLCSPEDDSRGVLWGGLVILVLAVGGWFFRKRRTAPVATLALLLVLGGATLAPAHAEAKSVTWSGTTVNNYLNYAWSGLAGNFFTSSQISGWGWGLAPSAQVSVTYRANVLNASGAALADGAQVAVGSQIIFELPTRVNMDISWFGTGLSFDSPYGHWINNANPPAFACSSGDFVNTTTGLFKLNVYIPFSVHNPASTLTQQGTAGLSSCSTSGTRTTCTVTSPGTINPLFTFPATYGKFYNRYSDVNGSSCTGSQIAMRVDNGDWSSSNSQPDYSLTIPSRTISYALTAVASNAAPSVPTITGPASGLVNTSATFTFSGAMDSDGDTVRYAVDWDNNGTVDQYLPATGYVSSGSSQAGTRTWVTTGAKNFKARAEDDAGNVSGWSATFTYTVIDPPAVSLLSAGDCDIPVGQDTCDSPMSWDIENTLDPDLFNSSRGVVYSSNPSGTGNFALRYGINTILARDGGVELERTTATASCVGGTTWNGTICVVPPPPFCDDGADNDSDGFFDYPDDPGCSTGTDTSEEPDPACADGIDNDGDGLEDEDDPGCHTDVDPGNPASYDPRDTSEFNIGSIRPR